VVNKLALPGFAGEFSLSETRFEVEIAEVEPDVVDQA
jgi:hypothetical protein